MQTATTPPFINSFPKTRKEIVTRLFREGHIDLDEVMELMGEHSLGVTPAAPASAPIYPYYPSWPVVGVPSNPWDTGVTYTV